MTELAGKKITVMGLGLHGGALGNIEWLIRQGASLTVTDLKTKQELDSSLKQLERKNLLGQIRLVLGEHRRDDFTGSDMVLRNPAVPRTSPYLQAARQAGVPIEMDSSLFFRYCPSRHIIGVTGSKGKTTTARAIATLLGGTGADVVTVGVDGISPLAALPGITPDTVVVFELSSWRLEALAERAISPATAVVTSIYREHLNTYESFEQYVATKQAIVRHQTPGDRAILNADDTIIRTWQTALPGQVWWYSMRPLTAGSGIGIDNGQVVIRLGNKQRALFSVDRLPLPSQHERRNLLPAILLAHAAGATRGAIIQHLTTIKRLPHRFEIVRELGGVTYINDSAATMPEATIAALQSLAGAKIIHILGGGDKKLDFTALAEHEAKSDIVAQIFLPGDATDRLKDSLLTVAPHTPRYDAANMPAAVARAYQIARPGNIVLLSPAATSFGLFEHEFDRGDQFRRAVEMLTL